MNLPPVTIVMSSYNGEKFIAEQIASIQQQTHADWKLLVRDDGSSDRTLDVVRAMAAGDKRISLLTDGRGTLGPAASFGVLLEHALTNNSSYVALSDQDDVWSPSKIARQLELIVRHERQVGDSRPILLHTDLAVVDQDLRQIHHSFLAYQGLRPLPSRPLGPLLIQNFVTGCTTLLNRALLGVAVPIPTVIMHDWWLALCSAALGDILYLDEATVRYRQHGRNTLGSPGRKRTLWRSLRNPVASWLEADLLLDRATGQARELIARVEREKSAHPAESQSLTVLRDFREAFSEGSGLKRLRVLARHRIRPRTFLRYPVRFYAGVLLWSPHNDLRA